MVITLFGDTTVKPGMEAAEARLATKLDAVLRQMPGFLLYTSYASDDGEEIGVIRFDAREHLDAWVHEGVHSAAQRVAPEYCDSFRVQTFKSNRVYTWDHEGRAERDLTAFLAER